MNNKTIPKKYMMVLQKTKGGQEAVEFSSDGKIKTCDIKAFTDKKYSHSPTKEIIVQKNTLAFYDALTNQFKDLEEFLKALGNNICPFAYKESTSYLGYLDGSYMQTLKLSFNDPLLGMIALKANGNNINPNNKETIDEVSTIIGLVEDETCDFVRRLQYADNKQDKRYNFSRILINNISNYHFAKINYDNKCREGCILNSETIEDVEELKRAVLNKIKSYKNFRELYRFKKQYLYEKETEYNRTKTNPPTKQKQKNMYEAEQLSFLNKCGREE